VVAARVQRHCGTRTADRAVLGGRSTWSLDTGKQSVPRRFTISSALAFGGISVLFALAVISHVLAGRLSVVAAVVVIVIFVAFCLRAAWSQSRQRPGTANDSVRDTTRRRRWRLVVILLALWAAWQVYLLLRLHFVTP